MKEGASVRNLEFLRPLSKPRIWLLVILALTFYLRLLSFGQYIDADVGNMGYQAWRMSEGEVLIDLEGPGKPPLSPMLYSLFIRCFGPSFFGLKIFGTIMVLLAVLAVYWLANQVYTKKVGLLAALLFGVFSSTPMVEGGTVNLETVLHLPYILSIGLFLKASLSGRVRWYFLAGVTAALATLVKQVGGVLFFAFLCYGIGEWWWRKNSFISRRHLLYRYTLLFAGALLPVFVLIIFYHFYGYTLTQLYDSMLGNNLRYVQKARHVTHLPLLQTFCLKMKDILSESGLLWAGTAFAVVSTGLEMFKGEEKPGNRILFWWVFWSLAALWIMGTFYWHYFLQIIAPFSVFAAYGVVASWKVLKSLSSLPRFIAKGVWVAILLSTVVIFVKTDYKYFFSYTSFEQTVLQQKTTDVSWAAYGVLSAVCDPIASYVRDHTHPSETIYVWGMNPQIFFLSRRRAATRYRNNFNLSQLCCNDPIKELRTYAPMVMDDLRRSKPSYIIQIFPFEYFPDLKAFVRDRYLIDKSVELPFPPYKIDLYRQRLDNETPSSRRDLPLENEMPTTIQPASEH